VKYIQRIAILEDVHLEEEDDRSTGKHGRQQKVFLMARRRRNSFLNETISHRKFGEMAKQFP